MRKWHDLTRVMIVDLDAHQGNGHETDFLNDDNVCIVDAYNPYINP
jgi:histone deacetylase 11